MEPPILETLADRIEAAHTALVIIDMQKDFCRDGYATSKAGRPLDAVKKLIPRLVRLRDAARQAGALVIYVGFETYPDHMSDGGAWLTQRRRSTYAADKIAVSGTDGMEFIEELSPTNGELTVHKHRYSGFKGTDLDMLLRAHNVRTVIPAGVSTNVCVESTFRDAFEHGYYVCLPEDACASWDMELHAATLKTANARFGLVTTIDEVTGIWASAAQAAAE